MKALAIRYWLIVGLAIFFISGVSPFVYIGAVVCASERPSTRTVELTQMISADFTRWTDPAWQKELVAQLPGEVSVALLDGNNDQLFRAGTVPRDPTPAGYAQIM